MKTRQAFLDKAFSLNIQEIDIAPAHGQILVKITSSGLCNWELNHYKGLLGSCPQTLGHEWCGVVVQGGYGFAEGDRVTGFVDGDNMAAFADYLVVSANRCCKIAEQVKQKHILGEPIKCITTVVRAARPEAGDVGVIMGCGPMGLWCIQAIHGNLMQQLIAIDIDDSKLDLAKKYGATHTINSLKEDAVEVVAALTGERMADFVIEGTGAAAPLAVAAQCLKSGRGKLVLMSSHGTGIQFDFRTLIDKGAQILLPHPPYSADEDEDMVRAVELINKGVFDIDGLVTHSFALQDINSAFKALYEKPIGYLKGVVVP